MTAPVPPEPPPEPEPSAATFHADDGVPLAARVWRTPGARGVLVVAHGIGEHAACYDHLALAAARPAGVDVVAFDFRGHGRSPGRRGVVRHYDDLLGDLRGTLREVARDWPGLPLFLLGHSNGGQVAVRVAADPPVPLAGLILSNPAIALNVNVPAWKIHLGKVLRRIAPGATLPTGLSDHEMTSDQASLAARRNDPLRHDRISPALFFGMVEGRRATIDAASRLRLPVLLLLGESDRIIDLNVVRTVFERIPTPDRTLLSLSDMGHEPFNERNREVPLGAVVLWLRNHLPGNVATAPPVRDENARF